MAEFHQTMAINGGKILCHGPQAAAFYLMEQLVLQMKTPAL